MSRCKKIDSYFVVITIPSPVLHFDFISATQAYGTKFTLTLKWDLSDTHSHLGVDSGLDSFPVRVENVVMSRTLSSRPESPGTRLLKILFFTSHFSSLYIWYLGMKEMLLVAKVAHLQLVVDIASLMWVAVASTLATFKWCKVYSQIMWSLFLLEHLYLSGI